MKNQSELLTSILMDLGLYGLALPFENPTKILMDVIKLKSIKTFSIFQPYVLTVPIMLKDMENIESNYDKSTYVIPDIFGDRHLIYVRKVQSRNKLLGQGYVDPMFDGSINIYNDLALGQAQANLYSAATPAFTFKYEQPKLLHLYNMTTLTTELNIEFALEHSDNLATVPNTAWESFEELAILDIKKFLYASLKHYNEIQSAYGTIQLKIDDWANAENDRKELIEKWRDLYQLDTDVFIVI